MNPDVEKKVESVSPVLTAETAPVTLKVSDASIVADETADARLDSPATDTVVDDMIFSQKEVLGTGLLGRSQKARRCGLNRPVVIKHIGKERLKNTAAAKRLKEDAAVMMNLTHPNLQSLYSCTFIGTTDATIVSDYVEGATLEEIFLSQGFLDVDYCIDIFKQIAEGLICLHQHGVTHRNLKPSNIVVQSNGNGGFSVKLLDGGIARFIQADQDEDGNGGALLTDPSYTSPEQCLGREIDAQSDIYVFGLLLYEALTGRKPFEGGSKMQTVLKQINRRPRKLSSVAPDLAVPKELESVVSKCLEKNKDRRYKSFDEILTILEGVNEGLNEVNFAPLNTSDSRNENDSHKAGPINAGLRRQHKFSLFISIATLTSLMFGVGTIATVNHRHKHHSGPDIVFSAGHMYNLKKMPVPALVELGEKVLQQGDPLTAATVFTKAAQKAEEAGESNVTCANLYGRIGEVYAILQQQKDGRTGSPANDFALYSAYLPTNKTSAAFDQFPAYKADDSGIRQRVAGVSAGSFDRLAERNLETAVSKFRKARKLSIQQKKLLELLADVKFRLTRLEESELLRKDLLKIALAAPVVDKAYVALQYANLGATQLAAGRTSESLDSFNKAMALDAQMHGAFSPGPNTAIIQLNMANALHRTDKLEEAALLLRKFYYSLRSESLEDTIWRIRAGEMLSKTLHEMHDESAAIAVDSHLLRDIRLYNAFVQAAGLRERERALRY